MDIYQWAQDFYKRATTEKRIIGHSHFGRELYAVKIGNGSPVGIVQYAIHGREYITAKLAAEHYRVGVYKGSCWLLPLVNPDGALLSEQGIESAPKEERNKLVALNGNRLDFSLWKANGRGVDLNVNFAAKWGRGAKNCRIAGAENYIGKTPFSEMETQALRDFTKDVRPDYTVSYHTKGEEIYWCFCQSIQASNRDQQLGLALSSATGYPLRYTKGSVGGYKDWCIQTYGIPSYTIEVGADSLAHPLKEDALSDIIEKNRYTIYVLSKGID